MLQVLWTEGREQAFFVACVLVELDSEWTLWATRCSTARGAKHHGFHHGILTWLTPTNDMGKFSTGRPHLSNVHTFLGRTHGQAD